ncbi:ParB/RepB/Spo0J family partition protein [Mesorhizobium sp. BHbdii]
MQLAHIPIDRLNISAVNMRHAKRAPDVSDILPSVRARGVLVPFLVRPNGSPETFEIVAGRRRYFAAKSLADERGEGAALPCAIMEDGDDADALEASLIENIARLDPDEVSQWETFSRLIREGRTIADIAADAFALARAFARLLTLSDDDVLRVLTIVMAETLGAGSAVIEALGSHLNVDMAACWQADDAFFELLRDKEIANLMLAEIGGKHVADGNVSEKVKTQKKIIRDFLSGENGRKKVDAWLPRWMKFPAESYTDRGGFRTADQWAKVRQLFVSE